MFLLVLPLFFSERLNPTSDELERRPRIKGSVGLSFSVVSFIFSAKQVVAWFAWEMSLLVSESIVQCESITYWLINLTSSRYFWRVCYRLLPVTQSIMNHLSSPYCMTDPTGATFKWASPVEKLPVFSRRCDWFVTHRAFFVLKCIIHLKSGPGVSTDWPSTELITWLTKTGTDQLVSTCRNRDRWPRLVRTIRPRPSWSITIWTVRVTTRWASPARR